MTYRNELHAAQLRIAALEDELAARQAELDKLRQGRERTPMRWIALPIVAAMAWIGFSDSRPSPNDHVYQLEVELDEARSETMQAREDGRAALEALRQQAEAPRRSRPIGVMDDDEGGTSGGMVSQPPLAKDDPLAKQPSTVELGHGDAVVWVDAEPSSELSIDGKRYGKTPLMVRVPPGTHALVLSHPRRGMQTRTITARANETVRVSVRLDGTER